ncbi:MAG: phosphopantothenoylcysteine decarboxylase, partial [Acidimicrobiales bacterium]
AEVADIVAAVVAAVTVPAPAGPPPGDLAGVRVLVTAGGTREPIDPVRFIANRSSGRQGHAVAAEAAAQGASVTLVTTSDLAPPPGVEVVAVETAAEMEGVVLARLAEVDVVVMAAAVADFRPKAPAGEKLKRADGLPELVLEPTPDILGAVCAARRPGVIVVGFAAETTDLTTRAAAKQARVGADLMVANDVTVPGAGFGHDTNQVVLLHRDGREQAVAMTTKAEVARLVLHAVARLLRRNP